MVILLLAVLPGAGVEEYALAALLLLQDNPEAILIRIKAAGIKVFLLFI
jgi:hypothetical protein